MSTDGRKAGGPRTDGLKDNEPKDDVLENNDLKDDGPEKDGLESYQEKRDFLITSEPRPQKKSSSSGQIFVVQEHKSQRLHYDFRLEAEGVLKSWAVPKGPSMNPRDKRLAVETEDHPIEYARFEGTIPEGQYGAGTVIIWDSGTYRNMSRKDGEEIPLGQALKSGHASFWLEGKRLSGGFALTRTQRGWILVKMKDEKAEPQGGSN